MLCKKCDVFLSPQGELCSWCESGKPPPDPGFVREMLEWMGSVAREATDRAVLKYYRRKEEKKS